MTRLHFYFVLGKILTALLISSDPFLRLCVTPKGLENAKTLAWPRYFLSYFLLTTQDLRSNIGRNRPIVFSINARPFHLFNVDQIRDGNEIDVLNWFKCLLFV